MKTDNMARRGWTTKLLKDIERAATQVRSATDYYAVMGANLGTTGDQLKELHRALARKFHPDLCSLPDAHDLCAKVNVAYDTLSDPKRRKAYLRDSKVKRTTCGTCGGCGHIKKQKGFKKVPVECPACGGTGEL